MLIHLSIMFLAVVCILLVVSVISLSKRLNNAARDLKNYADAAAKAECAKLRTRVESLEKGAVPDYEEALAAAKAVNDFNTGLSAIMNFDPMAAARKSREEKKSVGGNVNGV